MKRHYAFFHTFRIPRLRLLLPIAFFSILVLIAYPWVRHQEVSTLGGNAATVMIDPGHGGYDPGVRSGSVDEADVTLAIGQKLKEQLAARNISAELTRETDTDYAQRGQRGRMAKRSDLDQRMKMAADQKAAIFISLHVNVSQVASRGGAEVFYYDKTPGAKQLAESVQKSLHTLPNMSKRDAKPSDYYLLRSQSIPALIVECGYLNIERARLLNPAYQTQLAAAIADGIVNYQQNQAN